MKDISTTEIASRIAEQLALNPETLRIWVKEFNLNSRELGEAIAEASLAAAKAITNPSRFKKYQ